jgi:hypothetical protein
MDAYCCNSAGRCAGAVIGGAKLFAHPRGARVMGTGSRKKVTVWRKLTAKA